MTSRSNMQDTTQRLLAELKRDKKKTAILSALLIVGIVVVIRAIPAGSPTPARADNATANKDARVVPGCEDPKLLEKKRLKDQYVRSIDTHVTRDVFTPDERYFPIPKPVEHVNVTTTTTSAPAEDIHAIIERQVLAEAKGLLLESTMLSDHPVASINGKVLSVGEKINGFKLTVIDSNRCTLVKEGVAVTLQIHE